MRHRRRRHDSQLTNMKHRTSRGWEGYAAPDRRTENSNWEMFSHPSAKPLPPPPLALPDLNAAPLPSKGAEARPFRPAPAPPPCPAPPPRSLRSRASDSDGRGMTEEDVFLRPYGHKDDKGGKGALEEAGRDRTTVDEFVPIR
jgi:hypothetical protein